MIKQSLALNFLLLDFHQKVLGIAKPVIDTIIYFVISPQRLNISCNISVFLKLNEFIFEKELHF